MTHQTPEPAAPSLHSSLESVFRHVATAHYRLATADPLDSDVAARCLTELHDAMELVDALLSSLDGAE